MIVLHFKNHLLHALHCVSSFLTSQLIHCVFFASNVYPSLGRKGILSTHEGTLNPSVYQWRPRGDTAISPQRNGVKIAVFESKKKKKKAINN